MKSRIILFVITAALCLAALPAAAQQPVVAVNEFRNNTSAG